MNLSSRAVLLAVAVCMTLLVPLRAPHAQPAGDAIRQTLEQAREAGNRSVTVHVQGASLALLVTAIEGDQVVGRSAQHGRIVVRIDRIDAVSF
ncbi:MAG: hypothetical protein KF823_01470 [Xanthomonadales bacterium]|nr:hypothetical protein [Xanthomonadales bacterium]